MLSPLGSVEIRKGKFASYDYHACSCESNTTLHILGSPYHSHTEEAAGCHRLNWYEQKYVPQHPETNFYHLAYALDFRTISLIAADILSKKILRINRLQNKTFFYPTTNIRIANINGQNKFLPTTLSLNTTCILNHIHTIKYPWPQAQNS